MAGKPFTPYSSIETQTKFLTLPWVPTEEQERINSYSVYEQLYWNHAQDYKLTTRGSEDDQAIYLPRPRTIIETANRYIGSGFDYTINEEVGTPAARDLATAQLKEMFKRERIRSRYNANKRFGLIKGDWLWHLLVDPAKEQGSRLRLLAVDPGSYFPQYLDNDPERLWRVHLVERFLNQNDNKWYVKRLTYERTLVAGSGGLQTFGGITWSLTEFEDTKWFTNDYAGEGGRVLVQPTPLHPDITTIPVFHIPNFDQPGPSPWGSSELRGFERLLAALNQSASDEDLALALMGLGVYATESTAQPRDNAGNIVPWSVYPGKVLQGAKGFTKVEGIDDVTPYQDHIGMLLNELGLASGASAAATGTVDVQVAESGVALAMHLAPMLAHAAEKDDIITDVMTQLLFNVQQWYRVYEQMDFTECEITPTFGDKLPVNKAAEVNLMALLMSTDPPIISAQSARRYLSEKTDLKFEDNEGELVLMEREAITLAGSLMPASPAGLSNADPSAQRTAEELAADAGSPSTDVGPTPGAIAQPGQGTGV